MKADHTSSAGFEPDAAFTGAAERFFELLKSFGMTGPGKAADWSAMAAPLAGQFEQWLRLSQSASPWFSAVPAGAAWPGAGWPAGGWPGMPAGPPFSAGATPAGAAPGSTSPGTAFAMPPWPFALPLGPAAAQGKDAARTLELLGRLAQLQGELAVHWSEIARTAAQRFIARLGAGVTPPTTLDQALKLYELWVSCAEEAYAATVHKAEFGRLQAEIANTSAALLVEQRRHVDSMARAFGLPTRGEVDELYAQLQELRRRTEEPAAAPRTAPGASRSNGEPATRARGAKPRGAKQPRPAPRARKRVRARRPRS